MPRSPLILAVAVAMLAAVSCATETTTDVANETPTVAAEEVSAEIALLAHRYVLAYMSGKTWGFFGANCRQWIEMDYQWEKQESVLHEDGRVKVTYFRLPERLIGQEALTYFVDVDTGEVEGDNEPPEGRLGTAEGCDAW